MTYSPSTFGDEAQEAVGRRRRQLARATLIYALPVLAFFVVDAIGFWQLPQSFSGMYGNDDGMWAAWSLEGLLQWGLPFDLAPFNPLSGMGSTFLPNTPWLNPAALAFGLPFPREVNYLVSYFLYFIELSASLILLFRVIGLRPLEAILCAQLYLLMLFLPTQSIFGTLPFYSLAPMNAHLVAVCNVLLVLILVIGRYRLWANVGCGAAFLLLLVSGLFSAPITFLTYAPVYSIAGVALLLGSRFDAKELGWKIGVIALSAGLLWVAGVKDYLQGTALISSRAVHYPAAFAAGRELLTWAYWRQAWADFDTCGNPLLLCPKFPIFYLHLASLAGAALCAFERSKRPLPNPPPQAGEGRREGLRPLAIATLLIFAGIHIFDFTGRVLLLGSANAIAPTFFIWASYPFLVLFLGLLIFRIARSIGRLLSALLHPLRPTTLTLSGAFKPAASVLAVTCLALVIPALAWADWEFRMRLRQPPPPADNPRIPLLGQSHLRYAAIGPITRYLIEHAQIAPGAPFRGYTVTYLADPQGPLAGKLKRSAASRVETYVAARYFFDQHYRNRLQEIDLWGENIPTLEEYGQWVTKHLFLALDMLFSPTGELHSESIRLNESVLLHLYHLDLDLLPFLGVRYLITDLRLNDARVTLRAEQSADGAPTIYLYEIAGANLGTWSPTNSVVATSFRDAIALLRSRKLDLRTTAVVFEPLKGALVPAKNVTFSFVRGGFHVTADADGTAAIVLPVQYSQCWHAATSPQTADGSNAELHRVNAVQTLLTFSGHVDVTFRFAFGLFQDVRCRLRDAAELKSLGVN